MLLILPIFPTAPAQGVSDPWWGPVDRANPTTGWAIRIPLVVENRYDFGLEKPFVAAEVDFSRLLVEAGWTNATSNAALRSRGFTLDVDSIRVVQYAGGFTGGPIDGPATKPTPHRFYPALFEGKHRIFDPAAAAGTILFQVDDPFFQPQEKRYYYVYASPLEYTDNPAPAFTALDTGALDAYMWGTRGNVYLGYEPQQEGQTTHYNRIIAFANGFTTVTLSTYENGAFRPVASTASQPNPILMTASNPVQVSVPAGKAFKIEADKPILVAGYGASSRDAPVDERWGYAPGVSGSFADTAFDVYGWAIVSSIGGQGSAIRIIKAGEGTVTVNAGFRSETLTSSNPVSSIVIPYGGWTRVTGTGKFLVSYATVRQSNSPPSLLDIPFHTHQVPAVSGGPVGTQFYNQLVNTEGFARICPEINATVRIVQRTTSTQIHPEGVVPNVQPATFTKGAFCEEVEVPRTAPLPGDYEIYSTKEEANPLPGAPGPFRLMVGAGMRNEDLSNNMSRPMIGHYGGLGGVDYYTYGNTGLFGHYNDTSITVQEERVKNGVTSVATFQRSLQRDQYLVLQKHAESTGRFHIVSTKPIAAVSLDAATYDQKLSSESDELTPVNVPYVRHVVGRPMLPHLTIGDLEFRGPLVDLVSPTAAGRQVETKVTGPGTPLEYRVDVQNLGRWLQGARLDDTIVVSCTAPVGWTVEGCARELSLSGGSAERLNVVVTPTLEDVGQTLPIVIEARSKAGGAVATFTLRVHVEIRYGVGMWFDIEGGRKTMDPPVGLSPGETYRGTIVMKNTGSTEDRFTLRLEDPAEGWQHALLLNDQPATEVTLDGGESVLLTYRATAPNAEQGPQNLVSITAQSQSSALAADIIYPGTRIRPKIDLEMALTPQTQLAAPNESVVFNVTTRNKGNDVFTVLFHQDSVLPLGWTAELTTDEVSLNPNDTYVMQLTVRPVEGARAGDLASIKLSAEVDTGGGLAAGDEVSAVVVVRRVYNLTTPPLFDGVVMPGETLDYTLPILNSGNGQVGVELLPGAVDATLLLPNGDTENVADWIVETDEADVTLALNESFDLPLRIEVPALTAPGLYNVTFTTRLSREAVQNLTVPVQVATLARVELDGAQRIEITPGRPVSVPFVARNTGNLAGEYTFGATTPEGWNATFSPPRALLAPGERIQVLMSVNATRDATNGVYALDLQTAAEGHAPTTSEMRVDLARPQLYLVDATATGDLRAGELILVTATVGNRGGIAAENVSVALTVDGVVVDRVTLARVPVGATQVASMSWIATQRGGDVAVILDPDQEIELETRAETQKGLTFGSRIGTPGPTILLTLAALAIALAWRRR